MMLESFIRSQAFDGVVPCLSLSHEFLEGMDGMAFLFDCVGKSAACGFVGEVYKKLPSVVALGDVGFDICMDDIAWLKFLDRSSCVVRLMCLPGQAAVADMRFI